MKTRNKIILIVIATILVIAGGVGVMHEIGKKERANQVEEEWKKRGECLKHLKKIYTVAEVSYKEEGKRPTAIQIETAIDDVTKCNIDITYRSGDYVKVRCNNHKIGVENGQIIYQ